MRVYSNPYLQNTGGSKEFLIDNIKGWFNKYSGYTIPSFSGLAQTKFILSVTAQSGSGYYHSPSTIQSAFNSLKSEGITIAGVNIWNSFYDNQSGKSLTSASYALPEQQPTNYKDYYFYENDDASAIYTLFDGILFFTLVVLVLLH